MSVLIKGMVMPKHAAVDGEKDTVYKCAVLAHPDNTVELVIDGIFVTPYYNGHDIQRYPLTEIPVPHGRLIDADALENQVAEWRDCLKFQDAQILCTVIDMIHKAPTVIKAEVSE